VFGLPAFVNETFSLEELLGANLLRQFLMQLGTALSSENPTGMKRIRVSTIEVVYLHARVPVGASELVSKSDGTSSGAAATATRLTRPNLSA
jgi:hypothetical protein